MGSRFWATLPVDVLDWSEPGAGALEGRRALVADQRPEDRTLAARFLAQAGAEVEETMDEESALALLRAAAGSGQPYELAVVALDLGAGPHPAGPFQAGTLQAGPLQAGAPGSLAHVILTDPLFQATSVIVVVTPGRAGFAWPGAAGSGPSSRSPGRSAAAACSPPPRTPWAPATPPATPSRATAAAPTAAYGSWWPRTTR
ncbi:hypothetical protein ACFQYP_26775 [Nonomuraea antimicrobica]